MATDLIVFGVLLAVALALTAIGIKTGIGAMFLGAGMLSLYELANIVASHNTITYTSNGTVITLAQGDGNVILAISTIYTIANFLFVFYLRYR